jgi:hypothetical protein
MELFNARKLKFKAWNTETKLLMRLHNIDCVKGELMKRDHILLQFTGLHDVHGEEIYDMDVLLKDNVRFVVCWRNEQSGWCVTKLDDPKEIFSLNNIADKGVRLRNYFERG